AAVGLADCWKVCLDCFFNCVHVLLLVVQATKRAPMRPFGRMNEGSNEESADGPDTELGALVDAVLTAIIEAHEERDVG
ncbi:hypothetical protein NK983_30170, partial [Salmonella enterica subsp. enterica serovar Typhimurium]|nr:hypothetical protein [Salmonella enterica subsp. enterica serovar Typhimurium]